ncbi:MAG: hypothetical protein H6626_01900 [Pseudobdellovibrionaceae bacterium]|nr:hypothetical protein [Bdellovibrionales bacterium]USN47867.1 MAG: hypothetical protein H6626_01900 [Pseudobdellovibrionaceae bacterium]
MSKVINLKNNYPYIIMRIQNSVYEKHEVCFNSLGAIAELKDQGRDRGQLVYNMQRSPWAEDGYIDAATVEGLIIVVQHMVQKRNLRGCLVTAPDRCYYVEKDGSVDFSSKPPSGGIVILPVGGVDDV